MAGGVWCEDIDKIESTGEVMIIEFLEYKEGYTFEDYEGI